jgi:hypothetical protein
MRPNVSNLFGSAMVDAIENIKNALVKKCIIPIEFKYTRPKNLADKIFLASCGHAFSVEEFNANKYTHCPEDKKALPVLPREEMLPPLGKIVIDFKKAYQDILSTINTLSTPKEIGEIEHQIEAFNNRAKAFSKKFLEYRCLSSNPLQLNIRQTLDSLPDELLDVSFEGDLFDNPVLTECGHIFSRANLNGWSTGKSEPTCPNCRAILTPGDRKDPLALVPEREEKKRGPAALSKENQLQIQVKSIIEQVRIERLRLERLSLTDEKEAQAAIDSYQKEIKNCTQKLEQCKVEMRLIPVKAALKHACYAVPPQIGRISDDPVLSMEGRCTGRRLIHRDEKEFVEDPSLTDFVLTFQADRQALAERIDLMEKLEDREKIKTLIETFKSNKVNEFENVKHKIYSDEIIGNLKIDKNNVTHLQFWHDQTDHGCHGCGGVEVIHQTTGQSFRVPTRVAKMMDIASEVNDYPTHTDFIMALNQARSKRPHWWNNPLSWTTRTQNTKTLYEANTVIETLTFR